MSIRTQSEGLECRLVTPRFAKYIASLYNSIAKKEPHFTEYEANDGYLAVANEAIALDIASKQENKDMNVRELSQIFRNAHALPLNLELPLWTTLPIEQQIAWEMVARYCAFCCAAETASDASSAAEEFFTLGQKKLEGK
jgi:hypothetical protein